MPLLHNLVYNLFKISQYLLPLVGAPLSGWISDKIVIKYKKRRGFWYPEDRLRACLFGAFLPLTVLAPGLITKFVPGRLGLTLILVCFFVNGVGVSFACIVRNLKLLSEFFLIDRYRVNPVRDICRRCSAFQQCRSNCCCQVCLKKPSMNLTTHPAYVACVPPLTPFY